MAGSRKYYSEYVGHYVRFYLVYPGMTRFKSAADKRMYEAVDQVWEDMTDTEKDILKRLYLAKPSFAAEVDNVANETGIAANSIWKMVFRFESQIASLGDLV